MPDRDGYSLIEEIRSLLRITPDRMPAIALSAFGRTEDRVRILAARDRREMSDIIIEAIELYEARYGPAPKLEPSNGRGT